MNEQESGFKTGPISRVRSKHSGKSYFISTARELKKDYWSTAIIPIKLLFVPDIMHTVMSFIRNSEEEALKTHEEVKQMVEHIIESEWMKLSPSPLPKDGLSKGAKDKLEKS